MPRLSKRTPKFSVHKRSGRAFTRIDGKQIPLGPGTCRSSRSRYDRLIAIWLSNDRKLPADWEKQVEASSAPTRKPTAKPSKSKPDDVPKGLTFGELLVDYLKFAKHFYAKPDPDGIRKPTRTFEQCRQLARLLREHYERTQVADFSPVDLYELRLRFVVEFQWSRKHTNGMTRLLVAIVRFGVERKSVPSSVWHDLKAVKALNKNKPLFDFTGNVVLVDGVPVIPREGKIAPPVDDETFQRTLEHLPELVADMCRFQRHTGCRPGEVCNLRPREIDRSGDVWLYRPERFKTEDNTESRVVAVGERAKTVLVKYMLRGEDNYCFSPAESERRRRERQSELRTTPDSCGNRPGTNKKRKPKRKPGERYEVEAYCRAVYRAVDRVNRNADREGLPKVKRWSPNQIRKAHALEVRENPDLSLDHAQVALGHAKRETTERYYARIVGEKKAVEVARRIG